MHFPAGNHPSRKFSADQDAFLRWKSSLTDFSSKSGSISPPEIIPHRLFHQIRMHFSVGNHPSQIFLANQDQSPRRKSSLADIFSKSGSISPLEIIPPGNFQQIRSISPLEIIPPRHFLLIRMHFSVGNHPSQIFLANQDQSPRWKSSLADISC